MISSVWITFVLIGLPLSVSCLHEACHESLSIYNFSQKSTNKKDEKDAKAGQTSSGDNGLINDARYIL